MPSIVGHGGSCQWDVNIAQFLISGHGTPVAHIADISPGILAPRVDAGLAFSGHDVKSPQKLPGMCIVTANVVGSRFFLDATVAVPGANLGSSVAAHDDYIVSYQRPIRGEKSSVLNGPAAQPHFPACAKARVGFASFSVE